MQNTRQTPVLSLIVIVERLERKSLGAIVEQRKKVLGISPIDGGELNRWRESLTHSLLPSRIEIL
jgi:hypothetical protein